LTSPVALNSQFIDNATMKFVNVHALLCWNGHITYLSS
jgi:hypothetical protein